MIIIWGWRAVRTVLSTGHFFCPQCGGDTEYRHLALRQWFTLFFIPLIPLKRLGTCVECRRCKTAFTEQVLTATTLEVFAHHQGLANRAAVASLLAAAPPVDAGAVALGLAALAAAPGVRPDYDAAALTADLAAFADLAVVAQYLQPLAAEMTVEGREELLRRMAVLAERLPGRGPATDAVLERLGAGLAMSPAHVAGTRELARRAAAMPGAEQ